MLYHSPQSSVILAIFNTNYLAKSGLDTNNKMNETAFTNSNRSDL